MLPPPVPIGGVDLLPSVPAMSPRRRLHAAGRPSYRSPALGRPRISRAMNGHPCKKPLTAGRDPQKEAVGGVHVLLASIAR